MSSSNHDGVWARSLDSRVAGRAARAADRAPIAGVRGVDCAHARPRHRRERCDLRRRQQPAPASAARRRSTSALDDLVRLRDRPRYPTGFGWNFAMWEALQTHASLFDGALAWTPARFDLAERGERHPPKDLRQRRVLHDARRAAILGRTFTAADDRPGGGRKARSPSSATDSGSGASAEPTPSSAHRLSSTALRSRSSASRHRILGVDVGRPFDVALPLATDRSSTAAARRYERSLCWSCSA